MLLAISAFIEVAQSQMIHVSYLKVIDVWFLGECAQLTVWHLGCTAKSNWANIFNQSLLNFFSLFWTHGHFDKQLVECMTFLPAEVVELEEDTKSPLCHLFWCEWMYFSQIICWSLHCRLPDVCGPVLGIDQGTMYQNFVVQANFSPPTEVGNYLNSKCPYCVSSCDFNCWIFCVNTFCSKSVPWMLQELKRENMHQVLFLQKNILVFLWPSEEKNMPRWRHRWFEQMQMAAMSHDCLL